AVPRSGCGPEGHSQVHGSAGQARIVGVDGDQFTAGVDELEADHVTGQAPYAVPRTVRSGTDRPTHRNMGQGGHRFRCCKALPISVLRAAAPLAVHLALAAAATVAMILTHLDEIGTLRGAWSAHSWAGGSAVSA